MARHKSRISEYRGRYHRTIGRYVDGAGEIKKKKFLLGTDRVAAQIANARLEKLWDRVVELHEEKVQFVRKIHADLREGNGIDGTGGDTPAVIQYGPIWLPESLMIAEAIRNGKHEIGVHVGADTNSFQYVNRVDALRQDYASIIIFTPLSPAFYAAGQKDLRSSVQRQIDDAQELARMAECPVPAETGQMLYDALDAYGEHAVRQNPKEHGRKEQERARRVKESHPDIPLSKLTMSALEQIAAHWNARPLAKKSRKPISIDTVSSMLKTAKRFVDWAHRSDNFQWSKPVDVQHALKVRVQQLRTDEEIAALSDGVETWTLEELKVLYKCATDRDRLLILLSLNCGFAQAEICTLRQDELKDDRIRRIRRKNTVPGEWPLWPQTVKAIAWFKRTHANPSHKNYLLVGQRGELLTRQSIANAWGALLRRVTQDHPDLRTLPFKHLRKTAGQMVREVSDGEVSGVFLCHGQPVKSDNLSDVYTRRPFKKVADAVMAVGASLEPMFAAAPDAFAQPGARRSSKRPVKIPAPAIG